MRICTATGCGKLNEDSDKVCRHCGRQLRNTIDVLGSGEVVGKYRVLRYIGHGGFGVVYEGVHIQTGARVAIKETFDPASIRGFEREFEVLRALRHENLPQYYEVFTARDNGYLVMEFVEGQSLAEILQQQNQPLLASQVEGFALQLGNAVGYLHAQRPPLLHRDIKPANVRLRPDGVIKLVDFGILKEQRAADGTVTQLSRRAFSPAFAPLEQATPDGWVTTASDIYSLGATLYQLLTNHYPLASLDRGTTGKDPLPEPRDLNPALSPAMNRAIMQAMARKAEDRYPTVGAFLQGMRGETPVSAFVQPRPPVWIGVAVVALLLVSLLAWTLFAPEGFARAVIATENGTPTVTVTATSHQDHMATVAAGATAETENRVIVTSTRLVEASPTATPTATVTTTATSSATATPTATGFPPSATATTAVVPSATATTPATVTASPTLPVSPTATTAPVTTYVVPPVILYPPVYNPNEPPVYIPQPPPVYIPQPPPVDGQILTQ